MKWEQLFAYKERPEEICWKITYHIREDFLDTTAKDTPHTDTHVVILLFGFCMPLILSDIFWMCLFLSLHYKLLKGKELVFFTQFPVHEEFQILVRSSVNICKIGINFLLQGIVSTDSMLYSVLEMNTRAG